jgi:hypothetical protein
MRAPKTTTAPNWDLEFSLVWNCSRIIVFSEVYGNLRCSPNIITLENIITSLRYIHFLTFWLKFDVSDDCKCMCWKEFTLDACGHGKGSIIFSGYSMDFSNMFLIPSMDWLISFCGINSMWSKYSDNVAPSTDLRVHSSTQ